MATAETALLLPTEPEANENNSPQIFEPNVSHEELRDVGELLGFRRGTIQRRRRGPLHILILYGLSFMASLGGLIAALWGYTIVLTGPLDEYQRKQHRDSYEAVFVGMQSVVVLLTINLFWSASNFYLASKGWHEYPWALNMFYDLFMGVSLVVFGVMNMLRVLLDHVACDGSGDKEMEKKCDAALLQILIAEMIAISLGFLVTVFLHVLLVGRCCAYIERRNRSSELARRVAEEEQALHALVERWSRREEVAGSNGRVGTGVPTLLVEEVDPGVDQHSHTEEDLIDMEGDRR